MDDQTRRLLNDKPPEPRPNDEESCACSRCKELLLRLERLSYCLTFAQQLADVRYSL